MHKISLELRQRLESYWESLESAVKVEQWRQEKRRGLNLASEVKWKMLSFLVAELRFLMEPLESDVEVGEWRSALDTLSLTSLKRDLESQLKCKMLFSLLLLLLSLLSSVEDSVGLLCIRVRARSISPLRCI